jgi:hypothetical protein
MRSWIPELALAAILTVTTAGWWLHRHPLPRPWPEAEHAAPSPAPSSIGADVALVASPEAVRGRQTGPFERRDWAFAWVPFLEQEFGPWNLLAPDSVDAGALEGLRVVVIPTHAWSDLRPAALEALGAFTATGGVIVAEAGGDSVGRLAPARTVALEVPFAARILRQQQGWWPDGRAPEPGEFPGVPGQLIQPHGLKDDSVPNIAWEPMADREEVELMERIEALGPLPRWWRFPDAAPAWIAITHDEEGFGDKSAWMAQEEAALGITTTSFVIPLAITRAGVKALREAGSTVHLHWNRGFAGLRCEQREGWGRFLPYIRDLTLFEQAAKLESLGVDGVGESMNRNHGLIWDSEFGKSFRMLHAAGIAADSTYGPAGSGRFGYIFGTGLPYRPLDDTGWPFPLMEVPFLFQDDEQWSRADQERLVREAATKHHQLLNLIFHVNTMARAPSHHVLEGWRELPALARQHGVAMGSLDEFLAVWRSRLSSPLKSRWALGSSTLTAEFEAATARLSIRVPAVHGGKVAKLIRVDGKDLLPEQRVPMGAGLVLRVPAGKHRLTVGYR